MDGTPTLEDPADGTTVERSGRRTARRTGSGAGCTSSQRRFAWPGSLPCNSKLTSPLWDLPKQLNVNGRFMTRLTIKGASGLRSLAIALTLCVPVAAAAADAGFTDRIIVKY